MLLAPFSVHPSPRYAARPARDAPRGKPGSWPAGVRLSTLNATLSTSSIPDHELLRCIGTGSYGEVWLARTLLGTLRAIKVVYRQTFEQAQQFDREFKGLQKFEPISRSHEGLVDILQLGRHDEGGYFYYVMELADDAFVAADVRRLTSEDGKDARPHPGPLNCCWLLHSSSEEGR